MRHALHSLPGETALAQIVERWLEGSTASLCAAAASLHPAEVAAALGALAACGAAPAEVLMLRMLLLFAQLCTRPGRFADFPAPTAGAWFGDGTILECRGGLAVVAALSAGAAPCAFGAALARLRAAGSHLFRSLDIRLHLVRREIPRWREDLAARLPQALEGVRQAADAVEAFLQEGRGEGRLPAADAREAVLGEGGGGNEVLGYGPGDAEGGAAGEGDDDDAGDDAAAAAAALIRRITAAAGAGCGGLVVAAGEEGLQSVWRVGGRGSGAAGAGAGGGWRRANRKAGRGGAGAARAGAAAKDGAGAASGAAASGSASGGASGTADSGVALSGIAASGTASSCAAGSTSGSAAGGAGSAASWFHRLRFLRTVLQQAVFDLITVLAQSGAAVIPADFAHWGAAAARSLCDFLPFGNGRSEAAQAAAQLRAVLASRLSPAAFGPRDERLCRGEPWTEFAQLWARAVAADEAGGDAGGGGVSVSAGGGAVSVSAGGGAVSVSAGGEAVKGLAGGKVGGWRVSCFTGGGRAGAQAVAFRGDECWSIAGFEKFVCAFRREMTRRAGGEAGGGAYGRIGGGAGGDRNPAAGFAGGDGSRAAGCRAGCGAGCGADCAAGPAASCAAGVESATNSARASSVGRAVSPRPRNGRLVVSIDTSTHVVAHEALLAGFRVASLCRSFGSSSVPRGTVFRLLTREKYFPEPNDALVKVLVAIDSRVTPAAEALAFLAAVDPRAVRLLWKD